MWLNEEMKDLVFILQKWFPSVWYLIFTKKKKEKKTAAPYIWVHSLPSNLFFITMLVAFEDMLCSTHPFYNS